MRYTDTVNAREGAHDDLVLALALVVLAVSRAKPAQPGSVTAR